MSHARSKFIDALKVPSKAKRPDAELECVVALMDGLFAFDREAREQDLSLDDRHACARSVPPPSLSELHALQKMKAQQVLPNRPMARPSPTPRSVGRS